MDGDSFAWYVEHILCPSLTTGQIVVLDNAAPHHVYEIEELIAARGCGLMYLPACSPDFNPIEMLFSKIKALVRKGNWRELKSLWKAIWSALNAVTAADIRGWFTAAYPSVFL